MIDVIWEILCIDGIGPWSQVATLNFISHGHPCHLVTVQKALAMEAPLELKQQMKATEITKKDRDCLRDVWGTVSKSGFILLT